MGGYVRGALMVEGALVDGESIYEIRVWSPVGGYGMNDDVGGPKKRTREGMMERARYIPIHMWPDKGE